MQDENWFRASVRRQTQSNGQVAFDGYASGPAQRWIGSIPEAKYDTHSGDWLLGATDLTCLLILASWHQNQIVANDLAKRMLEMLALRFLHQFQVSSITQAEFKANKALPDGAATRPVDGRAVAGTPSDYQLVAAHCASKSLGGFAQFMDTGTGKTITSIETAVMVMEQSIADRTVNERTRPLRVLVVCPKQLRSNWGYELEKFCRVPYAFYNCRGGKIDRAKTILDVVLTPPDQQIAVMAISYGNAKGSIGALLPVEWDLIIADESQNFKSHRTQTWAAMEKLRDVSKKRIVLTATPIANTLNDLWTQLEFLGKGYSGFVTFEAFRKFHSVFAATGTGIQRLVGHQNVPLLQERLTRMSYVISIEEALPDLPDVVYDVVDVELGQEQRDAYEQLQTTLKLEVEDTLNSGDNLTVTMNNVLTMLLRLAHITSGFITYDAVYDLDSGDLLRDKRVDRFDPNPKLDELVELVKSSSPNSKILIWATWVQDIKTIAARLAQEGIPGVTFYGATKEDDRDNAVWRFNHQSAEECKWLCGNPQCGGVGLNLLGQADEDTNCDWIINYSKDWSYLKRKQGLGRNRRRGTRVPTRVTDLICEDTIDEDIHTTLTRKKDAALNLTDLRAILDRVLKIK